MQLEKTINMSDDGNMTDWWLRSLEQTVDCFVKSFNDEGNEEGNSE